MSTVHASVILYLRRDVGASSQHGHFISDDSPARPQLAQKRTRLAMISETTTSTGLEASMFMPRSST